MIKESLNSGKNKFVGILFFITCIITLYPSVYIIDSVHIRLLYGIKEVQENNLRITGTSQAGLHISNGDILPPREVTINFIGTAATWLILSILIYFIFVNTIVRWTMPGLYEGIKRNVKKIKLENKINKIKEGYAIAKKLALSVQKEPILSVILIDFLDPTIKGEISKLNFGFYKSKKKIIGNVVDEVWVEINNLSLEAIIVTHGEFPPKQVKEIPSIVGAENFLLPELDLDLVIIEPYDILKIISENPISKNAKSNELGTIKLNLQMQNGKPIYMVQQDVPGIGFRGITIDAQNGDILSEKINWEYGIEK